MCFQLSSLTSSSFRFSKINQLICKYTKNSLVFTYLGGLRTSSANAHSLIKLSTYYTVSVENLQQVKSLLILLQGKVLAMKGLVNTEGEELIR